MWVDGGAPPLNVIPAEAGTHASLREDDVEIWHKIDGGTQPAAMWVPSSAS